MQFKKFSLQTNLAQSTNQRSNFLCTLVHRSVKTKRIQLNVTGNIKQHPRMSSKVSKSYKYAVEGKKARDALNQEEQELYDLCHLSGVEISPAVLRIVLDLLKLNVSPLSIAEVLKSMIHKSHQAGVSSESKSISRPPSRKADRSSSRSGSSMSREKDRNRQEKTAKNNSSSHKGSAKT